MGILLLPSEMVEDLPLAPVDVEESAAAAAAVA